MDDLGSNKNTTRKVAKEIFAKMGYAGVFGRLEVASITECSIHTGGIIIAKLKRPV